MRDKLLKVAGSLGLILAVALAGRVAFAVHQARKIPLEALRVVPFQQETGSVAYALAQGKGFSALFRAETGPTAWLAPVYPLLVAGMFRLLGPFTLGAFFAVVFLNIVFSAAACVPIFYAGKRIGGAGAGTLAAWLWALFPHAILIPFEWIWETSLSALLAAGLQWATLAVAESRRARDWCGYGLLWGVALLTNPTLATLLPFLLGWAAYRVMRSGRLGVTKPALAAAIALLCCVPWTARNYVRFHRVVPLRSNLPFELWLGNNPAFDPRTPATRARISQYEQVRRYNQLGETAFLEEKWAQAKEFIRTHPALVARLCGLRVVTVWMGTERPVEVFLRTDSWLVRGILLCNLVAAIGALGGIAILFAKRNASAFPVAIIPIVFPCLYYVTHASLRYRHPIDPIVLLLTAIAAASIFRWARDARKAVGPQISPPAGG